MKIQLHTALLIVCSCLAVSLFAQGQPSSQVTAQAQQIDLLLKGGHLIDPKNQIDSKMDIAIVRGKIYRVAPDIPASEAKKVLDVSGLYVTPGLIDMHVHVFHGTVPDHYISDSYGSLPPDGFTFPNGVTTVVDAGSSGWRSFPKFKEQTIDRAQTRVLAFLNIVGNGMSGGAFEQDLNDMDAAQASAMAARFKDYIVGIKLAHFTGPDWTPTTRAVEAGNMAHLPVMVDFGGSTPKLSIEELLMKRLRPGDILTHTYSSIATRESLVDDNLKVKPFVFEAQKRGIVFDVGHGAGAFVWAQAVPSIQQGFKPNTMGTDLYSPSVNAGLKGLSNLLSKFLNIGMSLQETILRATWNPAQVINRPELGHLSVGAGADIAVFGLRTGDFGFIDVRGVKVKGTQKLETELTIRNGRVVYDLNGISASIWNGKPQ